MKHQRLQGVVFLAIGILIVLLVSGCTELPIIGGVSKLDIIQNPENYFDKNITLVIRPILNNPTLAGYIGIPEFDYRISEKDEEGKYVSIGVIYDYFYCSKCEITGTVKTADTCQCQKFDCWPDPRVNCVNLTEDEIPWDNRWVITDSKKVEDCLKESDKEGTGIIRYWRCIPDSIRKTYYIDVTKVRSLD